MSRILKGLLNEVNPQNYDSDIDYYNALNRKPRSRPEPDSSEPEDPYQDMYRKQDAEMAKYKKEVNVQYANKEGVAPNGERYNGAFIVRAKTPYQGDNEIYKFNDAHWGAKKIVDTVKKQPDEQGEPYTTIVYYVDNHKHGYWKPWKDEPPISKGIEFTEELMREGISQEDLGDLLFHRLELRYPDIVKRYGHEVVGDIVLDVAGFHAGAEELGTSDIGIMLRQIMRKLEDYANEQINELSPETLASYKKAAGADASKSDRLAQASREIGDTEMAQKLTNRANKRFSGIVRATKKEFDKDVEEGMVMGVSSDASSAGTIAEYESSENTSAISKALREEKCPECGGPMFSDLILAEKKDACYNKVRSRYKVWPSAYASGALVQCRKKGAANWGNKSKNEGVAEGTDYSEELNLSKMSVDELKNHIEELTNIASEMSGMELAYIRMDIDKAKAMLRRKLKQGMTEGYQDDSKEREENLRYARSRNPVADAIRKKLNPNQKPEKEQGVAEGKEDKIAQLKKDHDTAVYWSKNEKSPQKREAARQKAEKIKRHLDTQYKQGVAEEQLDEKCWDTHKQVGMKNKGGRMVPNCVPKESIEEEPLDENLNKWFKEKWVRFGPDGKIRGDCARGDDSEGKPKCLPQSKAQNLGKKGRASAAARKRREDPNPERSGKAINVATKKKTNESFEESFNMRFNEIETVNEDWQKTNKRDKTDGMSRKAVKAYRRENPGSKLKTAVTTKPSKLKKGSKAAKRRKSFCARMSGMKKSRASAKTKRDPDSPINKALRRWNCESVEQLHKLMMIAEQKVQQLREAANPAQQAAIAINMKKKGQKPKQESAIEKGIVDENLGMPNPGTYEQETAPIRRKGQQERVQKIAFEGKNNASR